MRIKARYSHPNNEQKKAIQDAGHNPIMSYNQTDFIKERVAVYERDLLNVIRQGRTEAQIRRHITRAGGQGGMFSR